MKYFQIFSRWSSLAQRALPQAISDFRLRPPSPSTSPLQLLPQQIIFWPLSRNVKRQPQITSSCPTPYPGLGLVYLKPAVFQPLCSLFATSMQWPARSHFPMSSNVPSISTTFPKDAGRIQTPSWGTGKPSHNCQRKIWNRLSNLFNWHYKKNFQMFSVLKRKTGGG